MRQPLFIVVALLKDIISHTVILFHMRGDPERDLRLRLAHIEHVEETTAQNLKIRHAWAIEAVHRGFHRLKTGEIYWSNTKLFALPYNASSSFEGDLPAP